VFHTRDTLREVKISKITHRRLQLKYKIQRIIDLDRFAVQDLIRSTPLQPTDSSNHTGCGPERSAKIKIHNQPVHNPVHSHNPVSYPSWSYLR
jgi:hypothetical protein